MHQQQINICDISPGTQSNTYNMEYLKSELSVFLNLLMHQRKQNHIINNKNDSQKSKLSIILSASEQYTSTQNPKQQSNKQQNRDISINYQSSNFYKKYFESDSQQQNKLSQQILHNNPSKINEAPKKIINFKINQQSLNKTNMNISQQEFMQTFFRYCETHFSSEKFYFIQKLKNKISNYQNHIKYLTMAKQKSQTILNFTKKKQDQLYQLLINKDKQQNQLRKIINQIQKKLIHSQCLNKSIVTQNDQLKYQIQILKNQNIYFKQLILLANKNYENLQNKYLVLQKKNSFILEKQNSRTIQSKSTQNNSRNSILRTQSNRQMINQSERKIRGKKRQCKKRQSTSQKYRKFFLQILKFNKE